MTIKTKQLPFIYDACEKLSRKSDGKIFTIVDRLRFSAMGGMLEIRGYSISDGCKTYSDITESVMQKTFDRT